MGRFYGFLVAKTNGGVKSKLAKRHSEPNYKTGGRNMTKFIGYASNVMANPTSLGQSKINDERLKNQGQPRLRLSQTDLAAGFNLGALIDRRLSKVLRKEHHQLVLRAFDEFDIDKNGYITSEEMRQVLLAMGYNPSENQVNLMMSQVDLDGNGTLDIDEFLKFMDIHFSFMDPSSELFPVFRLLDHDGNGCVRIGDIVELVSRYNLSNDWTEEDTKKLVEDYDLDDTVDFPRFIALLTGAANN